MARLATWALGILCFGILVAACTRAPRGAAGADCYSVDDCAEGLLCVRDPKSGRQSCGTELKLPKGTLTGDAGRAADAGVSDAARQQDGGDRRDASEPPADADVPDA